MAYASAHVHICTVIALLAVLSELVRAALPRVATGWRPHPAFAVEAFLLLSYWIQRVQKGVYIAYVRSKYFAYR